MAESILLGSFPAWAAGASKSFSLVGQLPPGHELRAIEVIWEFQIRSNVVGAGVVVAADYKTIMDAFFAKLRLSAWGITDAYNLTSDEGRAIAVYASGRDPYPSYLRVGDAIPGSGSAFLNTKIKTVIPFTLRNLENPSLFSPSTDQFNLNGTKLDIDAAATNQLTATLTVGGVVVNIVMVTQNVYALVAPVLVTHAGPPLLYRSKAISQNQDTESGQFLDLFLADERGPATVEGQVSQITVTRDGRGSPRNVKPTDLAQAFAATQGPNDGILPLDLTRNGGTQFTPSIWVAGDIRSNEWELPVTNVARQYLQNLASGGSASATLLYWQVRPILEAQGQLQQLTNQFQVQVNTLDQLGVRGGGGADNNIGAIFKGRYMQQAS
jgi:hypothetical protein